MLLVAIPRRPASVMSFYIVASPRARLASALTGDPIVVAWSVNGYATVPAISSSPATSRQGQTVRYGLSSITAV